MFCNLNKEQKACISVLLRKRRILRWCQTLVLVSGLALSVTDKVRTGHPCARGRPSPCGQRDLIKEPPWASLVSPGDAFWDLLRNHGPSGSSLMVVWWLLTKVTGLVHIEKTQLISEHSFWERHGEWTQDKGQKEKEWGWRPTRVLPSLSLSVLAMPVRHVCI